ncbi:MAG: hypothetical protein AAFR61_11595 [Bacteroidota bacterium]
MRIPLSIFFICLGGLLTPACDTCDEAINVGYQDRKLRLGMTHDEVRKRVPKLQVQEEAEDPERFYFSYEDPFEILSQTLYPILYFEFTPEKELLAFKAYYMLAGINGEQSRWQELLAEMSKEELPGLAGMLSNNLNHLRLECGGHRIYLLDSIEGYDRLKYMIINEE